MFRREKYPDEYRELMSRLIDGWEMKYQYAAAFLENYKTSIAKMVESGRERARQLRSQNLGLEGTILALDLEDPDLVLVCKAHIAYMSDFRRGKYVGTDTEKAIWAILANRTDLLENWDRPFAKFIYEEHEKKFPTLFDDVFRHSPT